MAQAKKVDLRQVEDIIKNVSELQTTPAAAPSASDSLSNNSNHPRPVDSGTALQAFFDHIPISSLPGIKNSPVLELKAEYTVTDAIRLLYDNNVFGAPIADISETDVGDGAGRFSHRYIGFIDFASLVLWSLEEFRKLGDVEVETACQNFFSMLAQNPKIGHTKVSELAKSFLWNPFLPVRSEDSLFHVLMLLSKHRLQVVPVVDRSKSQVIGFVTQNAVVQLLLQSSGLEWFDIIAEQALSAYRFEKGDHVIYVHQNQTIAEAFHTMWRNQTHAIAVLEQETRRLIGCIRSSDVYLLLDNEDLFRNQKNIPVGEFIHMETDYSRSDPTIDRDLGALLMAGILRLRNSFCPRMDSPVINKRSDSLKQAMENLAETKCNFSFLIDDTNEARGILTSRDVIVQFAPPGMDSGVYGGGFFESALDQTGCRVQDGQLISNK